MKYKHTTTDKDSRMVRRDCVMDKECRPIVTATNGVEFETRNPLQINQSYFVGGVWCL